MTELQQAVAILACALTSMVSCGDVRREPITGAGGAAGRDAGTGGTSSRQCTEDNACPVETPRCDLESGHCVECLDTTDCPGASCRGATACSRPEAILCHPTQHRCAECVSDGHCASVGERCSSVLGVCATPCTDAASCPGDESICDAVVGFCVECVTDVDCGSRAPYCRRGECTR